MTRRLHAADIPNQLTFQSLILLLSPHNTPRFIFAIMPDPAPFWLCHEVRNTITYSTAHSKTLTNIPTYLTYVVWCTNATSHSAFSPSVGRPNGMCRLTGRPIVHHVTGNSLKLYVIAMSTHWTMDLITYKRLASVQKLDPEVNPDPDYELPPPPPTRPGQQTPSRFDPHFLSNFPPPPQSEGSSSPARQRDTNNTGNFLSSLFSMLGTGSRQGSEETPRRPPPSFHGEPSASQRNGQSQNTDRPGMRTYAFNFGNARGSVTIGSFGSNLGRQGYRMNNDPTSPSGNLFNDPDPFRA